MKTIRASCRLLLVALFTLGTAARVYQWRYWQPAQFEVAEGLRKAVEARGLDVVSVAIAWVLAQQGVSSAIIGASLPEQLEASLAAPEVELDEELQQDGMRRSQRPQMSN